MTSVSEVSFVEPMDGKSLDPEVLCFFGWTMFERDCCWAMSCNDGMRGMIFGQGAAKHSSKKSSMLESRFESLAHKYVCSELNACQVSLRRVTEALEMPEKMLYSP